jgi:hypothetical protein
MPAMSYELVRNNMVSWIPPQFNFCVGGLTNAFYPFIFHSNSPKHLPEKVINKIQQKLRFRTKDPKLSLKRQCLKNIYDLGYFVHFAGCSGMMEDLHQSLQEIE